MKITATYGATIPTKQFENFRPEIKFELDSVDELSKAREIAFDEIKDAAMQLGIKDSIYLG